MYFVSFFRVQIHSWNAKFHEACSSFHQGKEQPDTSMTRENHNLYIESTHGSFKNIIIILL